MRLNLLIIAILSATMLACDDNDGGNGSSGGNGNGGGNDGPDVAENSAKGNLTGDMEGKIESEGKPKVTTEGDNLKIKWGNPEGDSIKVTVPASGTSDYTVGQQAQVMVDLDGVWTGQNGTVSVTTNDNKKVIGTLNDVKLAEQAGDGSATLNGGFNTAKDSSNGNDPVEVNVLTENIKSNTTWKSGEVYELAERISVTEGATLTIEPGTIIKGQPGSGANATALVIAADGKIDAVGTPEKPIIFTSVADEIQPGETVSPNMKPDQNGLWGGLVVLGNAPISATRADNVSFEGIPTEDETSFYGGSNPGHNAGKLKYISIRHNGANLGQGNEINGLSLAGVGNQTTVQHIEIVATQDDGLQCLGGTVDVSNVVVWNLGDDAYDMDQAYKGTIDNVIAIKGSESDHGLELDGPEGQSKGTFTIRNATIKGYNNNELEGGEYVDIRDDCTANLKDIYFFNHSQRATFELNDEATAQNYLNDDLTLENLEFDVSHLSDGNTTIAKIFQVDVAGNNAFEQKAPNAEIVRGAQDAGADKGPFGWSWASNAGELSDL